MSTEYSTNISELSTRLQNSINDLVDTFLTYKSDEREALLYSVGKESRHWFGCNEGAVMDYILRLLKNYNKDETNKDLLVETLYNGLKFNENNKYIYWLNISREMFDRFRELLISHYEWVQKGFSCEYNYVASRCKECAHIMDDYMNSEGCTSCGKVWWTSS